MSNDNGDYGYIQIGSSTNLPMYTVRVPVKTTGSGNWYALYEGRWRKVHVQVKRLYIVCQGEKFNIVIDGV